MRYCEKCHVTVRTGQKKCPLCQSELSGTWDPEDQLFPELNIKKTNFKPFMEWLTFSCILVIVVCCTINWIVNPDYFWSGFVVAGVAMAWVATSVGIAKRRNLLKNAMWETFLVSVALVIWDVVTGWEGWSVTYFLPIGILVTTIFMIVISMVQKLDSPEYMIYWLMNGVFGLLPMLFVFLKMVNTRIPSVICVGCSALLLAGLFSFQRKAVLNELHKKFHI